MEKTNLVIIGSGAAGLGAAVGAGEKGVKSIVLEKSKIIGGISVTGMGIFAAESHLQKEKNVNFSKDDAFELIMDLTQWKADPRLVRAYVNKTSSTIDWLEDMGVTFSLMDKLTYPGAVNQTGHLVVSPKKGIGAGATAHMIECMAKRAAELGADLRFRTGVTNIEKLENGYLVSCDCEGDTYQIEADAVVIGAGGFVHDKEMLADVGKVYGHDYEFNRSVGLGINIPLTGELIRMAWNLGAVPDGMGLMLTSYMDGLKFPRSLETQPLWDFMAFCFPYLWVNKKGERFVNEGNLNGCYMANAIARQKDGQYFMVFDQALVDQIKNEGPDVYGYLSDKNKVDIGMLFEKVMAKGADNYYIADSIEELAEKMGVPVEAFKETIEEYNDACDQRYDPLFAKKPKYLRPLRTPKYYAVKRMNAGYGSVGGIKINHKAEVIGKDYEAIPGLYSAGDCANGLVSYNTSLMYTVWGGTLGFAVNSGRIAGESAADYVLNKK